MAEGRYTYSGTIQWLWEMEYLGHKRRELSDLYREVGVSGEKGEGGL